MEPCPLFRLTAVLVALQLLLCTSIPSLAENTPVSAPTPNPANFSPVPPALPPESPSAKSPGEFLSALAKQAKPDWSSKFRPPSPTSFTSRAQNALTLGSVFADGQLAAQAEDVQQSKNISKDIVALAKPLGVQTELLDRGKSLADCAERKDWPTLRIELEAAQSELQTVLHKHEDDDLMTLVTLGAWMRSTEIVSALIAERYTPNASSILRQPVLAHLLKERVWTLSDKIQLDPTVVRIRSRLGDIERLLSGSGDPIPSPDEVRLLSDTVSSVLWDIAAKRN